METNLKLCLLIGIVSIYSVALLNASEKPDPTHLDLVITLDKGGRTSSDEAASENEEYSARLGRIGAVTTTVARAIYYSKPLIASSSLINNLILALRNRKSPEALKELVELGQFGSQIEVTLHDIESSEQPGSHDFFIKKATEQVSGLKLIDKIKNDFMIYLTPKKDLTLMLPKSLDGKALGLAIDKLSQVEPITLEQTFAALYDTPVDEQSIENMFLPNNTVPKYIFLNGHGHYKGKLTGETDQKASIAGLDKQQYKKLLQFFNTINCKFLYVSSCFAGGQNLLTMHKANKDATKGVIFDLKKILYHIVIASLTDITASSETFITIPEHALALEVWPELTGESEEKQQQLLQEWGQLSLVQLDKFFLAIHNFIEAKGTLKEALLWVLSLAKAGKENICNLPTVFYPGSKSFAPEPIDPFDFITTKSQQEYFKEQRSQFGKDMSRYIPKVVGLKADILVYPTTIDMQIIIPGSVPSPIISMIPGKAIHIFKNIDVTKDEENKPSKTPMEFDAFIASLFGRLSVAPKAYLVKSLASLNYDESGISTSKNNETLNIENLAFKVERLETDAGQKILLTSVFKCLNDKSYYKATSTHNSDPKDSRTLFSIKPIKVMDTNRIDMIKWVKIEAQEASDTAHQISDFHDAIAKSIATYWTAS